MKQRHNIYIYIYCVAFAENDVSQASGKILYAMYISELGSLQLNGKNTSIHPYFNTSTLKTLQSLPGNRLGVKQNQIGTLLND